MSLNILMTTPPYTASLECTIADGLIRLGHNVYNPLCKSEHEVINYGVTPVDGLNYDLWIMADTYRPEGLEAIIKNPDGKPIPKVIVHGQDFYVNYNEAPNSEFKLPPTNLKASLVFVRDLHKDYHIDLPTFPIDYGIERRYEDACLAYVNQKRELKTVFYGTLTTARREYFLHELERAGLGVIKGGYFFNKGDDNWSQIIKGRYTHDPNYYVNLCKFMFGFAPMGAGVTCFRHAELYAAGCIPLIQRFPDYIIPYHNFVDKENCLIWGNKEELIDRVRYYTDRPDEAEELRVKCYEWGQKYMSTAHIAEYLLTKTKEITNAPSNL
jgi:hypothetical protein